MLFQQQGTGSGGVDFNKLSFNTVNSQTIYTAVEIGVDLTANTIDWLKLNQTIQTTGAYSINAGGGITFVSNPGTKVCYAQYT